MHLYGYLKEWRKNPHWSFSCCLALVLPLVSLPGDISGLVETNVINNQLDTGDIEMPTIAAAVQDSGAIDITLDNEESETGEQGDSKAEMQQDDYDDGRPTSGKKKITTNAADGEADVVLGKNEQGDHNRSEVQRDAQTKIKKLQKGTQTELSVIFCFADEPVEETSF